jgi:hypothetical protein
LIAGFVPVFGMHPNVFNSLPQQSSKHFKTIIKMTPVILSYLFVGFAEIWGDGRFFDLWDL